MLRSIRAARYWPWIKFMDNTFKPNDGEKTSTESRQPSKRQHEENDETSPSSSIGQSRSYVCPIALDIGHLGKTNSNPTAAWNIYWIPQLMTYTYFAVSRHHVTRHWLWYSSDSCVQSVFFQMLEQNFLLHNQRLVHFHNNCLELLHTNSAEVGNYITRYQAWT